MVGFSDKFRSLVGQAREKVAEYSELAQTKIGEYKENLDRQWFEDAQAQATKHQYQRAVSTLKLISASSVLYEDAQSKLAEYTDAWAESALKEAAEMSNQNSFIQAISTLKAVPDSSSLTPNLQQKISEYTSALEQFRKWEKFEAAEAYAKKHEYQKAINVLKGISASSETYGEAQQKVAEYIEASIDYVFQNAVKLVEQKFFNEAISSLQTIPETSTRYQYAQSRIIDYTEEFEKFIRKHKNLVPVRSGERIVAAAFLDQTLHAVSSIERTKSIYNPLSSTYADGEFLILTLIVRNDSKKARTISASMMTLIDSQEREVSVSDKGKTALIMNGDQTVEVFMSEVQPGLSKVIRVVFDVPPGANDFNLKIVSGGWGGTAILPLVMAA